MEGLHLGGSRGYDNAHSFMQRSFLYLPLRIDDDCDWQKDLTMMLHSEMNLVVLIHSMTIEQKDLTMGHLMTVNLDERLNQTQKDLMIPRMNLALWMKQMTAEQTQK